LSRLITNERQTDVRKNLPCIPIVSLNVQRYFQAVQQLGLYIRVKFLDIHSNEKTHRRVHYSAAKVHSCESYR